MSMFSEKMTFLAHLSTKKILETSNFQQMLLEGLETDTITVRKNLKILLSLESKLLLKVTLEV